MNWTRLLHVLLCKIGIHEWWWGYDATHAACIRCGSIKPEPK
jgi:hypothetical protein